MRLFYSYLWKHKKSILMFMSFGLIFTIVCYCYGYQLDAVAYCMILCLFFGAIYTGVGFYFYQKRVSQLKDQEQNLLLELGFMPRPKDEVEKEYQKMIQLLFDKKIRLESDRASMETEMTDYYTLWAHQIKTPIAALGLLLQANECEQEEKVELEEQLFKIEQYVDMVLQYIRTESTTTDFVIKKHSLDDLLRTGIRKYARLFIRKKIQLDYQPMNGSVITDEKWMSFVIEQILSNALKYTPEGGKIRIYQDQAAWTTIVIEDNGIGIAKEDLPRVFDKGYTGYNGRSDKKSTGVGLYLCRQVMKKLGHDIRIESDSHKGTRVFLDLYATRRTD